MTAIFGTKEWASSNVNIQSGCPNDCKYCYAKAMAIRHKRKTRENWKKPVIQMEKVNKGFAKRKGTIMFPTTHDITMENLDECITVLRSMLKVGNQMLIVSKSDPDCILELCCELEKYREQILFRFTMGSANDDLLQFWEPGAPIFVKRNEALKTAYELGYATSVSCEPMLDNRIEGVVEATLPYVTDAIWIGLPNMLKQRVSINCGTAEAMERAEKLLACFTQERINELYETYKDNPQVKWKESIKKAIGLDMPDAVGLDI
ncbi:hypothetical protein PDESU_02445 [Pontiella desulfatans]|uniref:Radical SAM core domain-containing protein n=1 Tax=Pontiella desulfatans TaxID=2750659 RepID=A0A6C2U1P3_PONDE|nr:hypothetical protein [Pontiella desulfatans]VGO13888.1 hypothetical protein PDESU_02445 [Pontiella desulfatans]